MKKTVLQLSLSLSVAALAACSSMPGWMPGGTSVSLTGAEEVPPVATSAAGSASPTTAASAAR
jgi:hypothetical protein